MCQENSGGKRANNWGPFRDNDFSLPETSRVEILERAKEWVDEGIRYSQLRYHKSSGVENAYRTDCSGFVSMAWLLPASAGTSYFCCDTSERMFFDVPCNTLQPGDALVTTGRGHIILFHSWIDRSTGDFYAWEESGHAAGTIERIWRFKSDAVPSTSRAQIGGRFGKKSSSYKCIRRKAIVSKVEMSCAAKVAHGLALEASSCSDILDEEEDMKAQILKLAKEQMGYFDGKGEDDDSSGIVLKCEPQGGGKVTVSFAFGVKSGSLEKQDNSAGSNGVEGSDEKSNDYRTFPMGTVIVGIIVIAVPIALIVLSRMKQQVQKASVDGNEQNVVELGGLSKNSNAAAAAAAAAKTKEKAMAKKGGGGEIWIRQTSKGGEEFFVNSKGESAWRLPEGAKLA